jgi:hypothetical protein
MRILLVGDLHGDTLAMIETVTHAADVHADLILQLGDFGFWPRDEPGRKFLRQTEARLELVGLPLWWVSGNHEDLKALETRPIGSDGRRQVSDHVWHLPNGYRWVWCGTRWVAAGGAVSVDRYGRKEGVSWFRDEVLSDAEVVQIIADGPADVVVAHDAPWGVPSLERRLFLDLAPGERDVGWASDLLEKSDEHMRRVRRLVDGVSAGRIFHGHHHVRYEDVLTSEHGQVSVVGLAANRGPRSLSWHLVDETGEPIVRQASGTPSSSAVNALPDTSSS